MSNIIKGLIIIYVFTLMACTMPETRIYTLYMPVEQETINTATGSSIVIHVDAERYLKQPYIAYRSSPYSLEISKYSKWGSSPGRMVRKEFRNALSSKGLFKEVSVVRAVPDGFYLLKIYLKRFERLDIEEGPFGKLEFDVALLNPDSIELYRGTVSMEAKLDNRAFTSLAKGLSSVLKQAVEEVKVDVIKVVQDTKSPPPTDGS